MTGCFLTATYNQREVNRKAKLIISMSGNSTSISCPTSASDNKTFTFDHSYWSHDGYKEQEDGYLAPTSPEYADQVILQHSTVR